MDGIVLDLGCGTGSMTELLAEQGYDMIGVDNSEEMLDLAMEKRAASGQDILYLLQDSSCLTSIRSISTENFSGIRPLRRIARSAALSGKTTMISKSGSMNTI